MRPLLVLSLVIVAVATLLFVLFSLSGDEPEANSVADVGGSAVVAQPDREPETVRTVPDGPGSTSPVREERRVATNNNRESIQPDQEIYDNGITGRVFDPEGQPLGNVRITLTSGAAPGGANQLQRILGGQNGKKRQRTGKSNSDGTYRFRNLEPGGYSLMASPKEYSRYDEPYVVIHHGEETVLDIELREGLVLHGYVRDEGGNAIGDAELQLSSMFLGALWAPDSAKALADEALNAKTDETGYYRFSNVTPGQMHLTAMAEGYGSSTRRNLNVQPKNGTHAFDFRLEEGKVIAGRVYAPDRTAIVGASVEVIGYQPPQTLKATATTDQRGRFSVPNLVGGAYLLTVRAEGWGVERRQRVEAPDTEVEIEMTEQGSLMGRVVLSNGRSPVTSFVATLHQYIEQSASYGRTTREEKFESADGSFTMTGIPEGRYAIRVRSGGLAAAYSADFAVTQGLVTTDVLVTMSQGGSIKGKIYDAATGDPVARATIITRDNDYRENFLTRMFATAMPEHATNEKVVTDSEGAFEVELLTPDVYQLIVQHPRFPESNLRNVRVLEGEESDVGRIALETGGIVRGTVFDRAGEPLPGASVQLVGTVQGHHVGEIRTQTNSDGRFKLMNVPAGRYNLTASRPHTQESPFVTIMDVKNSQVQLAVVSGREVTQDLYLGGGS